MSKGRRSVRHRAAAVEPIPEGSSLPEAADDGREHLVDVQYGRLLHQCSNHAHFEIQGHEISIAHADIREHDGENLMLCVRARVVG